MLNLRIPSGLLALALAAGASANPTGIIHTPPAEATMDRPVPLEVRVAGVPDGEPAVVAHYRMAGTREYTDLELKPAGQSRYAGAIPAAHARAIELGYYISVSGPSNAYYSSLGAPDAPLHLVLRSPAAPGRSSWIAKVAVLLAGLGGVGLLVWLRERRQRGVVLDRIFWVRTLLPIAHLNGSALSDQIARLTSRPLAHPGQGQRTYSRQEVLRRLNEVRRIDLAELARARDRYLGPEFQLPGVETGEGRRRAPRQVVAFGKPTA
jgi:hypothetical protein